MVTFRIIEAMNGEVRIISKKEQEPNPSSFCRWQKLRMIPTPYELLSLMFYQEPSVVTSVFSMPEEGLGGITR